MQGFQDSHLICIYIMFACYNKVFWLNRSSPQDEHLKKGATEMYANFLKNTCNGFKLLSYMRSAILIKMNSFTRIFHELCYNIYVFTFIIDTAIFVQQLCVCLWSFCHFEPLYCKIFCQIITFSVSVSWLGILKTIASCKLCNFVAGVWYII